MLFQVSISLILGLQPSGVPLSVRARGLQPLGVPLSARVRGPLFWADRWAQQGAVPEGQKSPLEGGPQLWADQRETLSRWGLRQQGVCLQWQGIAQQGAGFLLQLVVSPRELLHTSPGCRGRGAP